MRREGASDGAKPASISIRPIKQWAATRLGADSPLRRVLETEQETIPARDFVVKLGVWLQLLEIEGKSR